jgi:ATP-dependent helicase HrpA
LLDTPEAAAASHRAALIRLFSLTAREKVRYLHKQLPKLQQSCLYYQAIGPCKELSDELVDATIAASLFEPGEELPRSEAEYEKAEARARQRLMERGNELAELVNEIVALHHSLRKRLKGNVAPALLKGYADVQAHLERLLPRHFLATTPLEWLPHLPRYLKAVAGRLEKMGRDPGRDESLARQLAALYNKVDERAGCRPDPQLVRFRWLLEELRVSLFAQELKTLQPVSVKRLERLWDEIRKRPC